MDEYTADAFANRDEPIALFTVTGSDVGSASDPEKTSKRDGLRKSASRLRAMAQDLGAEQAQRLQNNGASSIHDRLFAKLLQQVIPAEEIDSGAEASIDPISSKHVQRPAFSLPLMTNNFRRFNARIGIVFVFQNQLIRLFTWRKPAHTISFLSVYVFVCLDPYLLVVLPLAVLLLFIMIPAFIARHPPPPPSASTSSTTPYYSYQGPAIAPPKTIRPAAETSKDFFRNMRDLQNSMADFTVLHDLIVQTGAPLTNFSNEILSSTIFVYLTFITTSFFIIARLLPWRLIFLLGGCTLTICGHPTVQTWLAKQNKCAASSTAQADPNSTSPTPTTPNPRLTLLGMPLPASLPTSPTAAKSLLTTLSAITLDSAPEKREVEIFELQHRPLHSTSSEWQHHLFTPLPYDPLSPSRISGDRPHGTRFFEDVQPPHGWAWEGPKWELDLEPHEWVAERLITGVEYNVVTGAGEDDADTFSLAGPQNEFGGWVWDLPPSLKSPGIEEREMWLAYGEEYDVGRKRDKEAKERIKREVQVSRDWEEGRWAGRTGEWRRRRWVRVVKRVSVDGQGDEMTKS